MSFPPCEQEVRIIVMSEIKKRVLIKSAVGAVLGLLIGIGFILFGKPPETYVGLRAPWAAVAYLVHCALHGALCVGSQIVYDIEKFSIARATVIHFLITLISFYILGMTTGWFHPGDPFFWIITAGFVFVYFLIWLAYYISYRRKVRSMNAELRRWKHSHPDSPASPEE